MAPIAPTQQTTQKQYVVLTHTIYGECLLGFIDPDYPALFGVLSTSILRGWKGGSLTWSIARREISSTRPATAQDFADYRIQHQEA